MKTRVRLKPHVSFILIFDFQCIFLRYQLKLSRKAFLSAHRIQGDNAAFDVEQLQ